MSITIIINPAAGGVASAVACTRAEAALTAVGLPGEVILTGGPGHARELALAASRRNARLVIAWGGDGTVNEVSCALAFSRTALGIVPAGSGNGLARALGVSPEPEIAIREAAGAVVRHIDVGELGGRLFVNVAGVGFDAEVAATFATLAQDRRRLAGYLRISAKELFRYTPRAYRIAAYGRAAPNDASDRNNGPTAHRTRRYAGGTDGVSGREEGEERRAFLVTLANGQEFGNGARIAPGARVDDGLLDLVVVEESVRRRIGRALPALFAGRIASVPGVSIRRVSSVVIEADGPMRFHVDGEPATGGARLEARVHAGVLPVAVR